MKKDYLKAMRDGESLSVSNLLSMTVRLSIPTILAQISIIIMEYIDAAMVGRLGGGATAAIGLVASTEWLTNGICYSFINGFSVLAAQAVGAKDNKGARRIMKQAFVFSLALSAVICALNVIISGSLPGWLGGGEDIKSDATAYFLIFSLGMPVYQFNSVCASMIQSSGNTKVTGILETLICVLDVPFNYVFIFVLGMGVKGAAIGTVLAEVVMTVPFAYFLFVKSPVFRIRRGEKFEVRKNEVKRAAGISLPIMFENIVLCSAQVMTTVIVAPLGTVSVAAHSLAVTAEGLCYMPGYGISSAASTMIGQSIGAKRSDLKARLSYITVGFGMAVMLVSGVIMYIAAPLVMNMLTPVAEIAALGVLVLRIEAFAEPLFAASIVSSGVFRGDGDTLVPSVMNLVSMWALRIPLAAFLATRYGLKGVWIAMCAELCIRGTAFLIRLYIKNGRTKKYERI